jgi:hypothetical protein
VDSEITLNLHPARIDEVEHRVPILLPRLLPRVGVESIRRLVLVPLLHAISMHKRRDKPSAGCAENGENAKRKKQKG